MLLVPLLLATFTTASKYDRAVTLMKGSCKPEDLHPILRGLPRSDWPDLLSMAIVLALEENPPITKEHLDVLRQRYSKRLRPSFSAVCQRYLSWSCGQSPFLLYFLLKHCDDPYALETLNKWMMVISRDEEILYRVLTILFAARQPDESQLRHLHEVLGQGQHDLIESALLNSLD